MDQGTDIERTGRNEAKLDILDILNTMGTATSWQISVITGQTPEAASMCLRRYHKQGLLNRTTLKDGHTRLYEITPRGRQRLAWLVRSE